VTDAPRVNAVGDFELTDPAAMRALADPIRLALFDRVRRAPASAATLAESLDEEEPVVYAHLSGLEAHGLVSLEDGMWRSPAKGFVFEIPEDAEGQAAARRLSALMMLSYDDLPRRWVAEVEPDLDLGWVRASGLFNARVALTPDELRGVQEGLERVLEPFLTREAGAAPAEARSVRILAYFLPESRLRSPVAGSPSVLPPTTP
jgi:DNA-binding transcriptional ArsR family regulator